MPCLLLFFSPVSFCSFPQSDSHHSGETLGQLVFQMTTLAIPPGLLQPSAVAPDLHRHYSRGFEADGVVGVTRASIEFWSGFHLAELLNQPKTNRLAVHDGTRRFRAFLLHDEIEALPLQHMDDARHDAQRPRQTPLCDPEIKPLRFASGPELFAVPTWSLIQKQPGFFNEGMREHRFGYGRRFGHGNTLDSFEFRGVLREYGRFRFADLPDQNRNVFHCGERRTRDAVSAGYFRPMPESGKWNLQLAADFGKTNVGDAIFTRQCDKRKLPDLLVKLLSVPRRVLAMHPRTLLYGFSAGQRIRLA